MDRTFSLYLDFVRFVSAALVVLSHYKNYKSFGIFDRETAAYIPDLGREAVIVFFVLSGYVICHTTTSRPVSLGEYAAARCARIYSVAAPILILTFLAAFVAMFAGSKAVAGGYAVEKAFLYVPFHLLFLGELWNLSEVPPWLGAYWSLGFEVWYYIFFGTLFYLKGPRRLIAATIVFAIMGHKLWLLMPIWFSGVLLYKSQSRLQVKLAFAYIGWIGTFLLLVLYKACGVDLFLRELGNRAWNFSGLSLGSADRYLADYVVCLLIILNFSFALNARLSLIEKFASVVKGLSSYTFTLYLVHGIVMSAWVYFYATRSTAFGDVLLLTVLIVVSTYLMGSLTERRKHLFHRFFVYVFQVKQTNSPSSYSF